MRKGFNKILIIIMSVALLGLILIQMYWLREALISSRSSFEGRVYQAMSATAQRVNQMELEQYHQEFASVATQMQNGADAPQVVASTVQRDSVNSTIIYVTRYELQQNTVPLSEKYRDSLTYQNLYKQERTVKINKDSGITEVQPLDVDFENTFRNSNYTLERFAKIDAGNRPLEKRIRLETLDSIFRLELSEKGLSAKPQIAVFSKDSAIALLKSPDFVSHSGNLFTPLFKDSDEQPSYLFAAHFPERTVSILGPVIPITALTVLLTLIIIAVFWASIYSMLQQRKISEVKTDFINNMTHELKTPLATINVATDALKNSKISSDPDRVKHYSNLIKQESKRMNQQVEMVLRMSRLERDDLQLNRQLTSMHDLIEQQVLPIQLMVEERSGTVFEDYQADPDELWVDAFHMGNIILNILDNANKYSFASPQIKVHTYTTEGNFVLKVSDNGIGMAKSVLKKVFEQFYRAETGNVHNVKGQGLGLAYVKKIVELHDGLVWAESEKGKGSTFFIQLPIQKELKN